MKKYIIKFLLIIFFTINLGSILISQPSQQSESKTFYFDAVCFKSDNDTTGRVDVFVIVPYQSLQFIKSADVYGASYEISIDIRNEANSEKIETKKIERNVLEEDFQVSQGGTAKFDYSQSIFFLPPGQYKITANVTDAYSKQNYERSRTLSIIDFMKYPFSMSGILLVSSIEEKEGRYVITPHISDNIGDLKESFFIFFETYNFDVLDSADFVYEISNVEGKIISQKNKYRFYVNKKETQHFIKIDIPKIEQGAYTLRLITLKPTDSTNYEDKDFLAIAERSLKYYKITTGQYTQDIANAIKQLRYVATQTELDFINAGLSLEEKEARFLDFWKNLDPSPGTERNEAYDQYYSRVNFANQNFKSYTEGWRTDKGMVYIIYGPPFNIERTDQYPSDTRQYERWTYQDNRRFIFVDNSGFGDYRLYSPMSVSDKYRYQSE